MAEETTEDLPGGLRTGVAGHHEFRPRVQLSVVGLSLPQSAARMWHREVGQLASMLRILKVRGDFCTWRGILTAICYLIYLPRKPT